jgi:hypothetical protein
MALNEKKHIGLHEAIIFCHLEFVGIPRHDIMKHNAQIISLIILKTTFCYDKVNNRTLSSSFWFVVRVNKFCLEIKFEMRRNFYIF